MGGRTKMVSTKVAVLARDSIATRESAPLAFLIVGAPKVHRPLPPVHTLRLMTQECG